MFVFMLIELNIGLNVCLTSRINNFKDFVHRQSIFVFFLFPLPLSPAHSFTICLHLPQHHIDISLGCWSSAWLFLIFSMRRSASIGLISFEAKYWKQLCNPQQKFQNWSIAINSIYIFAIHFNENKNKKKTVESAQSLQICDAHTTTHSKCNENKSLSLKLCILLFILCAHN